MRRRSFVKSAAGLSALAFSGALREVRIPGNHSAAGSLPPIRSPLDFPPVVSADNLVLNARVQSVQVAPGVQAIAWSPGTGPVGPTIRVRQGETARIKLNNALNEPTILHWHGLRVPEPADGHPRLAIPTGGSYQYEFPVIDRPGTYWYHAHPHHRTGIQAYHGMAGVLIVAGDDESLGLPVGDHDIPLLIQDKRLGSTGDFVYEPAMHARMEGFFGEAAYVNGVREPEMDVETAAYRLRIINGTTSRILRLALSNGADFALVGSDGGLLPASVQLDHVMMGTGERCDVIVDFTQVPEGSSVSLISASFDSPARMPGMGGGGGMGRMGAGGVAQGGLMTLMTFHVRRVVKPSATRIAPAKFGQLPTIDAEKAAKTRTFRFDSAMMRHSINAREFDMERIDETVKFGDTEIWTFINDSPFAHPVHVHEVHFQVVERQGGRNRIFPWETGLKDTVLVYPGERVSVVATFNAYRGRFLLHCHNMVHEDMGMMMNFAIV